MGVNLNGMPDLPSFDKSCLQSPANGDSREAVLHVYLLPVVVAGTMHSTERGRTRRDSSIEFQGGCQPLFRSAAPCDCLLKTTAFRVDTMS